MSCHDDTVEELQQATPVVRQNIVQNGGGIDDIEVVGTDDLPDDFFDELKPVDQEDETIQKYEAGDTCYFSTNRLAFIVRYENSKRKEATLYLNMS